MIDRRAGLKWIGASSLSALVPAPGAWAKVMAKVPQRWGRGHDGQRIAARGDGTFLNPIFAGDHPDPAIIKDGDKYYVTFSSFDAYPGLMIWESNDLVNWSPVGPALWQDIGSVWAPDLVKHQDRYYLYIPARRRDYRSIYVIVADTIAGPWSAPIDLKLHQHIDPAHVVGADGQRYLFLSKGDIIALSEDGLSTDGPVRHVYDPWRYPADWVTECFCPEGPKFLRRDDWYYMITAIGGTAGPPTGHMVIAARARSPLGPWHHAPNNPQIRTASRDEHWWSRGHASLIEGPLPGDWYLIYHGYEKEFWTLGRQCLLEPVRWRQDGWFEAVGGDLSSAFNIPSGGVPRPHGMALSDQLDGASLGPQWRFYQPGKQAARRLKPTSQGLWIAAQGDRPADASPLCVVAGDRHYRVTVEIRREAGATAGLLLFYSSRLYCGLGFDDVGLIMHRYGTERRQSGLSANTERLFIRLENDHHIVTIWTSVDGQDWRLFDVRMEVSGYHHNTAYEFLSLRPALYAAGTAGAWFRNFQYQAF